MGRDGIPDVLQQGVYGYGAAPAVNYAAPASAVSYAAPGPAVSYAAPTSTAYAPAQATYAAPTSVTVTGVDMNRDGIPDVLQQGVYGYGAAPAVNYAAPGPAVSYPAPTSTAYAPAQATYAAPTS